MAEDEERQARALLRERTARKVAEQLLEEKSLALYHANQSLQNLTSSLEQQVVERTAQLRSALGRAEASTRAKSDFLAMMSHEIRTPMNGILGMAELMEFTPLNAEQRGYLSTVRSSGDALLVLINAILDLSKVESGKLELENSNFHLLRSLHDTLELYQPLANRKGLKLHMHVAPEVPERVCGDGARLCQILGNLITNAIKFTAAGQVHIDVSLIHSSAVEVHLAVSVQDTGIGIPADRMDRLFQPFSQVDTSTTRQFGGSGLGLAISARLCASMRGSISVHSTPGTGSVFRFDVHLGLATVAADTLPTELNPIIARRGSAHILVVDDDLVNRTMALAMLGKLGLKAQAAQSGQEAIDMLTLGRHDIVLMDMQMPGMDGVQATQAIRGLRGLTQPHIIALTANAYESDRQLCLQAGMDDFLSKPLRLAAIREKLAHLLHTD
jgi:signal transduction histidine kinase